MKEKWTRFFASRWGIILTGAIIGFLGSMLQKLGNPTNMGICVACFERDIAGALGLHRASVVQYLRPEIPGFVLGALAAAILFGEFKARSGSAPIVRFVLGFFAMVGALAFLGCPWRASFRLAGGDLTAVAGFMGLVSGIAVGVWFLRSGYNLGRSHVTYPAVGLILPAIMLSLLVLRIFRVSFSDGGPIFFSAGGPGSMYAPLAVSLAIGLGIGFLAQRTRFCTMGAFRDVILMRDFHLVSGLAALIISAFITNMIFGQVSFGYAAQPVAHSSTLWNVLGMMLSGLAYALAGGCPGRQLFLSGEGDGDSGVFVLGMITGAAFAHNFSLAGKPDAMVDGSLVVGGMTPFGMGAVLTGLAVCVVIGFAMREKFN